MVKIVEKLKYVREVNGNLFWAPSKRLQQLGFAPKPLGPKSDDSVAEARELIKAADEARRLEKTGEKPKKTTAHPKGSLEQFWHAWTGSEYFLRDKKTATIKDYWTAWNHINARLGHKVITQITVADIEAFDIWLEENTSARTRKRSIDKLKQCLRQAVIRKVIPVNPADAVISRAAPVRYQTFFPNEIASLIASANALNMTAMGLCIRLTYACGFSPIDARALNSEELIQDRDGWHVEKGRGKTGVRGIWPIDQALAQAILDYRDSLQVDLLPKSPIFRRHIIARDRGYPIPWRDSREFSKDFAMVRAHALGEDETRRIMDIRRTYNVELDLGSASKEERAAAMANGLDKNSALDKTYTPATLEAARQARKKRIVGQEIRAQISGQNTPMADHKANKES